MFATNLKIINDLKQFISLVKDNPEVLQQFTTSEKSFSRERKLSYSRLVLLIAKLCKKTPKRFGTSSGFGVDKLILFLSSRLVYSNDKNYSKYANG